MNELVMNNWEKILEVVMEVSVQMSILCARADERAKEELQERSKINLLLFYGLFTDLKNNHSEI